MTEEQQPRKPSRRVTRHDAPANTGAIGTGPGVTGEAATTSTSRTGDRRPWPTAPSGRASHAPFRTAVPPEARTASAVRLPSEPSTPGTVWNAGLPARPAGAWPLELVGTVTRSFSVAGSTVVLLATAAGETGSDRPSAGHPVVDHRGPSQCSTDDAAALVQADGREVHVVRLQSTTTRLGDAHHTGHREPGADLVIAFLSPTHGHVDALPNIADRLALCAARRLRLGGILAVLTHCDWSNGVLIDPTGVIVSAGQSADLLYLQHVIAVHEPLDPHSATATHSATDGGSSPGRATASLDGLALRTPHQRIHSDVLVFAQHAQPPATSPSADAALGSEQNR